MRVLAKIGFLLVAMGLAACASPPVDGPSDAAKIAQLTQAIIALGPEVDPQEAQRAARIAVDYPRQLAVAYQISDPPITHNRKVNLGLRPRGLCWHWAEDMQRRLVAEEFVTLDLHRAIANYRTAFRIEHSTVIVSARGDDMFDGLVLDPWRWGGLLYWGPVDEDLSYPWRPQAEVLADKRLRRLGEVPAQGL